MENTENKILTEENLAISAKLDSVFMREKELMLFKEIVGAKVKSTNFNQSPFSFSPKLLLIISGMISVLILGVYLLLSNYGNETKTFENYSDLNSNLNNNNLSESNRLEPLENQEDTKHNSNTELSIKRNTNESKPKVNSENSSIEEENYKIDENLKQKIDKAIDVKIIDGYEVSSRESVVSTGILLIENADISKLKIKVSEILTNFKLKNTSNSSDVLNIASDKYVGELKNGQIVLFNIQFKIFKENPTKLQVMLRYNQILNQNEVKKSEAINIDKLFYHSLKQEITQKLTQFLK